MVSTVLSNDARAGECVVSVSTEGADRLVSPFEMDMSTDGVPFTAGSSCPCPDVDASYVGFGVKRVSVEGLEEPIRVFG